MRIGSVLENQELEKRISITPDIIKKYSSLGFEVVLSENYGRHLGINDDEYLKLGVKISKDDKEILSSSDIIVQLGMLPDDKISIIKENQILIGVLDPYNNKDKLEGLAKKKIKLFSLELLPRITRAQSMDILSSQANLAGYKAVIESFANFEKAIPMMMTAAGIVPAAVIIIGIACSKLANESTTALYPARFACDDNISIDCALVILGSSSSEKILIFFLAKLSILSLLSYGFNTPINVWFSFNKLFLSSLNKPN